MPKLSAEMNVMCQCCKYNDNNRNCSINDKEEEFYEEGKDCDGFKLSKWHLIDFLRELKKGAFL